MVRHFAFGSLLLAIVISVSLSLLWISDGGKVVRASTLETVSLGEHPKVYRRFYRQAIPLILTGTETSVPVQSPAPIQNSTPIQVQVPAPVQDPNFIELPAATEIPVQPVSTALEQFASQVADGQPGILRGVYVEGVLALEVLQQPVGNAPFVSNQYGFATQFQLAAENGVAGLLAHNYLSGELFYQLAVGQEVHLVFGDGSTSRYVVSEIQTYRKLEPGSLTSGYIELNTDEEWSTEQIFRRFYTGPDHVTFQTCIKNGQEWSWGILFVTAIPAP